MSIPAFEANEEDEQINPAYVLIAPTLGCFVGWRTPRSPCGGDGATCTALQSQSWHLFQSTIFSSALAMTVFARSWTALRCTVFTCYSIRFCVNCADSFFRRLVLPAHLLRVQFKREWSTLINLISKFIRRSDDTLLQGSVFSTFESKAGGMLTSAAWDLAHEQLVMADVLGVVQIWNTYTGSVSNYHQHDSVIVQYVASCWIAPRLIP